MGKAVRGRRRRAGGRGGLRRLFVDKRSCLRYGTIGDMLSEWRDVRGVKGSYAPAALRRVTIYNRS